ncbi:hypothetical protein, partial [Thermogemmatispora sp.]|uniref:hypothetical protein n=1 Tax=Thermogemmatispora sp. TaxID=1968838 RepID=UPI002ACC30AE
YRNNIFSCICSLLLVLYRPLFAVLAGREDKRRRIWYTLGWPQRSHRNRSNNAEGSEASVVSLLPDPISGCTRIARIEREIKKKL